MGKFESFCEVISTNVENRILSWHGRNDISSIQAIKLIHNRYMLGGFIISADVFHPLLIVTNTMSMVTGNLRIHGNELKRDNEALDSFYGHYKERFDKCENNESIESLKNIIASSLYRISMDAIYNTCEFGG
jgi:hypothetical protein